MGKIYRSGDECVLDRDSQEFSAMTNFCGLLNEYSPLRHNYVIEDIYLDFGLKWMWTTIVDTTADCQVLSPALWLEIVNETSPANQLLERFFNGEYCQDRVRKVLEGDKVQLKFGYIVDIIDDQNSHRFIGYDVNDGKEISFKPYDIEKITRQKGKMISNDEKEIIEFA